MDKAVEKYRKRRQARLDARHGASDVRDAVEEYKKRKAARMDIRGEWNENDHPRGKDGKFTSGAGGGSGSISPRGKEFHHDPKERGGSATKGSNPKVKGVTFEKSDGGFDIPVFDEKSFDENVAEKKKIARQYAKKLVPAVKKQLSTKVNDIERPKVDEKTREYLKNAVSNATPEQIEEALSEADKIYKYWEKNEPAITNTVVGAVKDVGGSMYGLDNRRKFDKSLAKKALGDAFDPNLKLDGNIKKAAERIKDGARYTAVFDDDNFVDGYNKVKEELAKAGIKEYRCKNFWSQYRDNDGSDGKIGEQKSVQCVFETPDGELFELQFHTPRSMAAKEVNHATYKQKKEPPSEHQEFNDKRSWFMRDTSSVVSDPKGVFDIEEHKRGETGYK